jgi:hypothetical protein
MALWSGVAITIFEKTKEIFGFGFKTIFPEKIWVENY